MHIAQSNLLNALIFALFVAVRPCKDSVRCRSGNRWGRDIKVDGGDIEPG